METDNIQKTSLPHELLLGRIETPEVDLSPLWSDTIDTVLVERADCLRRLSLPCRGDQSIRLFMVYSAIDAVGPLIVDGPITALSIGFDDDLRGGWAATWKKPMNGLRIFSDDTAHPFSSDGGGICIQRGGVRWNARPDTKTGYWVNCEAETLDLSLGGRLEITRADRLHSLRSIGGRVHVSGAGRLSRVQIEAPSLRLDNCGGEVETLAISGRVTGVVMGGALPETLELNAECGSFDLLDPVGPKRLKLPPKNRTSVFVRGVIPEFENLTVFRKVDEGVTAQLIRRVRNGGAYNVDQMLTILGPARDGQLVEGSDRRLTLIALHSLSEALRERPSLATRRVLSAMADIEQKYSTFAAQRHESACVIRGLESDLWQEAVRAHFYVMLFLFENGVSLQGAGDVPRQCPIWIFTAMKKVADRLARRSRVGRLAVAMLMTILKPGLANAENTDGTGRCLIVELVHMLRRWQDDTELLALIQPQVAASFLGYLKREKESQHSDGEWERLPDRLLIDLVPGPLGVELEQYRRTPPGETRTRSRRVRTADELSSALSRMRPLELAEVVRIAGANGWFTREENRFLLASLLCNGGCDDEEDWTDE